VLEQHRTLECEHSINGFHKQVNLVERTWNADRRAMSCDLGIRASPGPTTKGGTASCIGSDMSIVGNIECDGPAQVFGRIEGELRASDLLISDGAQVEGKVIAQDVTVCGRVKGTISAVRVKLQNGGAIEGDIFHRSLSIEENSQFEGSSRRVETQQTHHRASMPKARRKKIWPRPHPSTPN
jgi:cytoskeletal protein CcmA (bactofilin family)